MTKKSGKKRTWAQHDTSHVKQGDALIDEDILAGKVDMVALKSTEKVFELKNLERELARERSIVMKDPKVVLYRNARKVSLELGPELAKLSGGSANFHALSSYGAQVAKAVELYYKAEAILQNKELIAEAKAMIKKGDDLTAELKKAQSDAAALAGQIGLSMDGVA